MKEFYNRNKPVFVIGLVTALVFLAIIALSQNKAGAGPSLKKVENVTLIEGYNFKKGSGNPKVTLIEFSDFECPACKAFHPIINDLYTKYSDYMILAFRHFPLPQHENAKNAAIAAQAAGEQNKFWEYTSMLFESEEDLTEDVLISNAEKLGLNVEKFKKDLKDQKFLQQVENDINAASKIGLNATPSFIINNQIIEFNNPGDIEKAIQDELKKLNVEISSVQQSSQSSSSQNTESQPESTENNSIVTANGEKVTVEYTKDGFRPNNLKLQKGTTITFVNTVDRDIYIRQLIDKYKDFRNVKMIKKGESYTFVLTETDLWTFKEDSVRHYGSIFVSE